MAEQRIDLNIASAEELAQLPGIGPVLAQRVVTYRETVRPFDEPAEITAVSGIGEQGYRAIADRLTVTPPAEGEPLASEPSPDQVEEDLTSEPSEVEEEPQVEPESVLEEDMELGVRAAPPGESVSEGSLPLEEEAPEEEASEEKAPEEGVSEEEVPEEVGPEGEAPEEQGVAPAVPEDAAKTSEEAQPEPETAQEAPEEEELAEAQGEPSEYEAPPSTLAAPAEAAPPSPWWRRVSWLWTAMLGGLFGMIFALIVWAGINGSLDVGHSWAVLDLESEVNGLAADVETVEAEIEGLGQRLDALEGLKARMDEVESSADSLRQETAELRDRTDAMETEVAAVSEEVQALSEDLQTLREQAERTESFFGGLQVLLNDVFGEFEGGTMPAPTPTPTPEGK